MIYNVYAYRDKMLSCYLTPMIVTDDKEHFPVLVTREFIKGTDLQKSRGKDLSLYFLGTYDDKEAKFDLLSIPEKLLDIEDYINERN